MLQPFTYPFPENYEVIDGDSIRIESLDLGFYHQHRTLIARVWEIDCPEMKTAAGKKVKEVLEDILRLTDLKKSLMVSMEIPDKYHNRFLARFVLTMRDPTKVVFPAYYGSPVIGESISTMEVEMAEFDLSQLMVYLQLAFLYSGGSKTGFWTDENLNIAELNADMFLSRTDRNKLPETCDITRLVRYDR